MFREDDPRLKISASYPDRLTVTTKSKRGEDTVFELSVQELSNMIHEALESMLQSEREKS